MFKQLTEDDVVFTITAEPEDVPVRGNAIASGDDEYDREVEDKILDDLTWNEWAWCCVKVTARLKGTALEGTDYLGCCSYSGVEEFCKPGGYYEDMKDRALEDLQQQLDSLNQFIAAERYRS